MFITHDLAVASYLCAGSAVRYLGRIVEIGPTKDVLQRPVRPYTQGLLQASPRFFEPILEPPPGEIPSSIDLPPGCRLAGRCIWVTDACRQVDPTLLAAGSARQAAGLHPLFDLT